MIPSPDHFLSLLLWFEFSEPGYPSPRARALSPSFEPPLSARRGVPLLRRVVYLPFFNFSLARRPTRQGGAVRFHLSTELAFVFVPALVEAS